MVKMSKNIVIIDDSRTSLQLIKSLIIEDFPEAKFHLFVNSLVAYQNVHRLKADLFIIDIHMPNMNGFEILAEINSSSSPIYFVSSSTDVSLLEKAFVMGVSEYFVKPFNVTKFKSKIKEVLVQN